MQQVLENDCEVVLLPESYMLVTPNDLIRRHVQLSSKVGKGFQSLQVDVTLLGVGKQLKRILEGQSLLC